MGKLLEMVNGAGPLHVDLRDTVTRLAMRATVSRPGLRDTVASRLPLPVSECRSGTWTKEARVGHPRPAEKFVRPQALTELAAVGPRRG